MLRQLQGQENDLSARYVFLKNVNLNKIPISKDMEKIKTKMLGLGITAKYHKALLDIPIRSLTTTNMIRLKNQIEQIRTDFIRLQKTTPEKLYLSDLKELEEVFD